MNWNPLTSSAMQCTGILLAAVIEANSTDEPTATSVCGDTQRLDLTAACACMSAITQEAECTLRSLEESIPQVSNTQLADMIEEISITTNGYSHLALSLLPESSSTGNPLLLYVVFDPQIIRPAMARVKLRDIVNSKLRTGGLK